MRKPIDGPYYTKQGVTLPIFILCEDEQGPAILEGATIRFLMRQQDGSKSVAAAAAAVNSLARKPDPDAGWVRYDPTPVDMAVPGLFRGEVEVTYAPGTPSQRTERFPYGTARGDDAYIDIIIHPNLA